MMRSRGFGWALALLAMGAGGQVLADQAFVDAVRGKIVERTWSQRDAAALAEAQELSFALHDANGTLDTRLDSLGRYADDSTLQELIARHPAWLDFFLTLQDPDTFATAFDTFSDDWHRRETLLEAMLANPRPEGLRQFERVVTTYGDVLRHLVDAPEFGTLIDELMQAGLDGATPDFIRWLHDLLKQTRPSEIEARTVMLAGHGGSLRRKIDIAERWEVLAAESIRNPDLGDLLIGHLGIWDHLGDTRLIDAINGQLNRFDRDKAQLVLIFLLGYENSLSDVSAPESWRLPLRREYTDWIMERLLDDPADPPVEAAFHFRGDDRFWAFTMREGIAERMPCLLAKVGQNINALERYFDHNAAQAGDECRGPLPDWAPASSFARLVRKAWHGTPMEVAEVGWAVLDVADVAVTVVTFGGGKLALPVVKGGTLAARGLRGAEAIAVLAQGERVAASAVKARILETNAARRATRTLKPGLSRMLNITPTELATRAAAKADELPEPLRKVLNEMAHQATGRVVGELIQNAMTTEFIRCAGIKTLPARDPVCRALFPPEPQTENEVVP